MKRIRAKLVVGSAIAAIGMMTNLGAQTNLTDWNIVQAITVGTQVRITTASGRVEGALDQATAERLVLISGAGHETFERQQVSVVSVKKAGHRKRNALIGLGVGAGGGAAIGATGAGAGGWFTRGEYATLVGVFGALGGVVTGVLIPTGGWSEVYRTQ
jgi:hypothetical protein